jgi:hyperosmotically inducible periplasmic protein
MPAMFRRIVATLMIGFASVSLMASGPAVTDDRQTTEAIHKALARLPYYGVFDFLAFRYDQGTVTLSGYAYALGLKDDAARAVKRVPGVDEVVNQIEPLSVSPNDDRIRWGTFYRIYNDTFLSRYAPGGGAPVRFDRQFFLARYPGMQPFGNYPIHIIVRNGRTLLVGSVDFESDKIAAGFRAREVPGSFGVENEIVVPQRGTR